MVELAHKTKTNIGFGVQENNSALYLEYALGEPSPNRRQRVGFRVPLVRTAMGRACIAAMNFEERARLYSEFKSYYGSKWKDIHQELDSAIEQVETDGYCFAIGTFKKNTNSVAVPFLHLDNHTIMAFNSQSSDAKQPLSVLKKNGQLLLDMVDKVRGLLIENHTRPKIGRV
jgi:DNA-binding IclR family transcriptional regulator